MEPCNGLPPQPMSIMTRSVSKVRDSFRNQPVAHTSSRETMPRAGLWIFVYTFLTFVTNAYFMADTVDYVAAVYKYDQGINYVFWDFRHLFWRPLGWVVLHLVNPFLSAAARSEPRIVVIYIFLVLNWIAGLFSLFLFRALLRRFCAQWTIEFSSVTFVFSFAFLNYVHSGSSYIPGLMFLLLGLYFLSRGVDPGTSNSLQYWGPLSLAISVCLWFPYAFAVPGALVLPLFSPDRNLQRWPLVLRNTAICVLAGIVAYGAVLAHQGIYTVAGAIQWAGQGATSVAGVRGFNRAVFGFAHSFIDMGRDGVLFKRFLLHDPYNPVSLAQLMRLSLWKLAVFYAVLLTILVQLKRSGKTNVLAIATVSAAPVLLFALFWFGGDVERYLPLYPAFFLALGCAVDDAHHAWIKTLAVIFLLTMVVSNCLALSRYRLQQQQRVVEARLQPLLPLLKPSSVVVEVDIHDNLVNFSRSFPLNPINRSSQFHGYPLLNPGTPQVQHWREDFAEVVQKTWKADGDVWISERVLATVPQANWDWIEKADPHLTWNIVYQFFSPFDFGTASGGSDGFLLLLPTGKNRTIVNSLGRELN